MAKYSYITDKTHNNRKIQVESAKRDGSGKNIENNYAKQNGNYQSLTAGLSNNFDTKKVMVDESAYNFRQTATMGSVELEVGSPCKVKKIIGGSVAFNQSFKVATGQVGSHGVTITPTNDNGFIINGTQNYEGLDYIQISSIPLPIGYLQATHKYIVFGISDILSKATTKSNDTCLHIPAGNSVTTPYTGQLTKDTIISCTTSSTSATNFYLRVSNGDSWNNIKAYINLIDLTQMFGSAIADYIYSLEQANAGSGVAWFKRYFPKEYYAYNSGELVSVKTQGKKITHFNQWDEEWELGIIDFQTGEEVESTNRIRSKNFIPVLPNTTYYFNAPFGMAEESANYWRYCWYDKNKNYISGDSTKIIGLKTAPANAYYLRFNASVNYGTTYNHDICINFHYDGERDGEYEPYNSETYPCDDVELRGIPQLDENNNLAFDGDEYANDGNVTRKYGIVDLGTLNWTYSEGRFSSNAVDDMDGSLSYVTIPNFVCAKYTNITINQALNNPDKTIYKYQKQIGIIDSAYTDAQTFKTAMSGVYLIYPLATPTNENSIPFTEVQECDNWGTEEWLAPTTDTRPCEVPVGHETDYLPDLKAKVEVAPNTPNENGVYVMEHNASGNSYTPIATWLTNNGYKTEETMKDTFGMKDALGGTLRQLLATKESLDFDNTAYVDLGSLTWTIYDTNVYVCYPPNLASYSNDGVASNNIICSNYKIVGRDYVTSSNDEKAIGQKANNILFYSSTKNATQIQAFMKGVLLAYKKES